MRKRLQPTHADSAGCRVSRPKVPRPRPCSRGRGHIGRQDHPVESALVAGEMRGWRADSPGTQTIRLIFDQPQRLTRIAVGLRRNRKHRVPESSSCDGLRMADARFEKLCASSGISVLLKQYARSRTIGLNSRMSSFLNWSLCPTSVKDWLAPRSRV